MKIKTPVFMSLFALVAFTGCADLEPNNEEGPDVDLNVAEEGEARPQRSQSELNQETVAQDPELWRAGSCAGACGGAAPGKSCWCDSGCDRYGDCCSDYVRECVDGSSGSKPKKPKKKKSGSFSLTSYSVSGGACQGRHKTILTNSLPGGSKDYIQSTFDDFDASSPGGSSRERCRVTVYAKWTPGTRVILDSFQLSGHADLSGVSRGRADVRASVRSGYASSSNRSASFNSPFSDSFDRNWSSSSMKVYSSCSGSGSFTFDMNVGVRGDGREQASASVDVVSALFRMAKSYEVPGC